MRLRSTIDREASSSPNASTIDDESLARLRQALATLPEIDREIVTLRAWEGLSASDIALVVGGTPENVRVRLHRARGRLRTLLDLPDILEEQLAP